MKFDGSVRSFGSVIERGGQERTKRDDARDNVALRDKGGWVRRGRRSREKEGQGTTHTGGKCIVDDILYPSMVHGMAVHGVQ